MWQLMGIPLHPTPHWDTPNTSIGKWAIGLQLKRLLFASWIHIPGCTGRTSKAFIPEALVIRISIKIRLGIFDAILYVLSGGHWNMFGRQSGGTHRAGMLSSSTVQVKLYTPQDIWCQIFVYGPEFTVQIHLLLPYKCWFWCWCGSQAYF